MPGLVSTGLPRTLGWSLLHTLWQAAAVYAGLRLVLTILPTAAARARYHAALGAGVVLLVLWVGTTAWLVGGWREHARCWDSTPAEIEAAPALCRGHGRVDPRSEAAEPAHSSVFHRVDEFARALATPVNEMVGPPLPGLSRAATPLLGSWPVVWAAVFGLLALGTVVGHRSLRRMVAESEPVADRRAVSARDELAAALGLPAGIPMRSSARVSGPGVAGWGPGAIVVPHGLSETLSDVHLRALLAHELAHVRGGDYAVGLAQLLLQRALFFNPWARVLSRSITEEREALRDHAAVGAVGSRRSYVEMLLALEETRARRPAPRTLVPLLAEGTLLSRVHRLLPGASRGRARWRVASAVTAAALATAILVEATLAAGALSSWAVMSADMQTRQAAASDDARVPVPATAPHSTAHD